VRILSSITATCTLLAVAFSAISVTAQENQPPVKPPCIAADEPIYRPGVDGVKPPQPQPDKNAKGAPDMRGPFSVELLVNSEGHICEARVLNAKDPLPAAKAASYISEHWTFKPATREGKPVAVKFMINFGPR
jgi:hypothetical protein